MQTLTPLLVVQKAYTEGCGQHHSFTLIEQPLFVMVICGHEALCEWGRATSTFSILTFFMNMAIRGSFCGILIHNKIALMGGSHL